MANLNDDEVIRYEVKPHTARKNMEVVSVYCNNDLVCTFYMHSKAGRRFAFVLSNYLKDSHVDLRNVIAPTLMIDFGDVPKKRFGEL